MPAQGGKIDRLGRSRLVLKTSRTLRRLRNRNFVWVVPVPGISAEADGRPGELDLRRGVRWRCALLLDGFAPALPGQISSDFGIGAKERGKPGFPAQNPGASSKSPALFLPSFFSGHGGDLLPVAAIELGRARARDRVQQSWPPSRRVPGYAARRREVTVAARVPRWPARSSLAEFDFGYRNRVKLGVGHAAHADLALKGGKAVDLTDDLIARKPRR